MDHAIRELLEQATPFESNGDWDSAVTIYQEAFRRSVAESDATHLIESVLRAGFCYSQKGEREDATEYLELALVVAERWGDSARTARALNGLAALSYMHGEIPAAESLYQRAKTEAEEVGDPRILGNIEQNLGVLAVSRGDLAGGLRYYESALSSYRKASNQRWVTGVLSNLGMLYVELGQLDIAAPYLDEALETCRAIGDTVTEGLVHINRTELFLARHELDHARSSCDAAFEIVSRLGENAYRSDTLRLYGLIYREAGQSHLAETHLQEAIDVARTHSYPLEEAEAQRELALVMRTQDRNREALTALNRANELFTSVQARQYGAEIEKRINQLQADFISLVQAWGESIEAKDRYTSGHCERVADYACRIAERAGVEAAEMIWFRMGSFLHDVGKTEIPEEILNKPGRLTDEERTIMERHTVIGDEMLSSIEFPWDVRPMVRSHHERWDGRGYPDGLSAEEIPSTARILHIADVFDALTTTRSYREPLSPEQALQIMQDDHGSFDPTLFELFLELYPEFSRLVQADTAEAALSASASDEAA